MAIQIWYWLAMALWAIFYIAPALKSSDRNWSGIGANVAAFAAALFLGLAVFGGMIQPH